MTGILRRDPPAYMTGKENHYAAPRNPIMQAYDAPVPKMEASPATPMSDIDRKIVEKERDLA